MGIVADCRRPWQKNVLAHGQLQKMAVHLLRTVFTLPESYLRPTLKVLMSLTWERIMAKTWILVANASQARIFFRNGIKQELTLVKELMHPESRMKNSELVTDRAGYMQGTGNSHGSKQPQTEPKQNEALHFAQELAQELNSGRCSQQFERIVLVAPPAFMGLLGEKIDTQTAKLIDGKIGKDYTQADEKTLIGSLE